MFPDVVDVFLNGWDDFVRKLTNPRNFDILSQFLKFSKLGPQLYLPKSIHHLPKCHPQFFQIPFSFIPIFFQVTFEIFAQMLGTEHQFRFRKTRFLLMLLLMLFLRLYR